MRTSALRLAFALALAAVVAGLALSCSNTEAPPLSSCADTCGGCCAPEADGGETCVPFLDQSFGECGRAGATCRACVPGQICSSGQCLQDTTTDSGQPDAGVDSGTPDAGQDSGVSCGQQGQACCHGGSCFLPLVCGQSGLCEPQGDGGVDAGTDAGSQPQPVGSACASDAGCTTNDCATAAPFTADGYCTKGCSTDNDCPSGSVCGYTQNGSTLTCLATCSAPGSQNTCRTGYVCDSAPAFSAPVCVPAATGGTCSQVNANGFCCGGTDPNTTHDQACCDSNSCNTGLSCAASGYCAPSSGPQPIGSGCTGNSGCSSNDCIQEESGSACGYSTPDTCWASGYCTQSCSSTACPSGSACSSAFGSLCLQTCTYNGGQGTCRSGYVCDKFWTAGSGSTGAASCISQCYSTSDCPSGTTCDRGFCSGALGWRCLSNDTCKDGSTCQTSGIQAGYCE